MSAIDTYGQNGATSGSSPVASDEARAALWAGIIRAAKHIGKRDAAETTTRRPEVVQLKTGDTTKPVYFIGAGLFEYHLAQLMVAKQSVYAVEITWPSKWHDAAIANDKAACPPLEQLVAPYVAAIRAHGNTSPCVLIGYSFNGNIAFEAARQLTASGRRVDTVMLLDAPSQYPRWYGAAWKSLKIIWGRTSQTELSFANRLTRTWRVASWSAFEIARLGKQKFQLAVMGDPGLLTTKLDDLGRPLHWQLIERLYDISLTNYTLRKVNACGVIFRADRAEDCPTPAPDSSLGWCDLFEGGLKVMQMSGGHKTMVEENPHDVLLASEMSNVLEQSFARLTNGVA